MFLFFERKKAAEFTAILASFILYICFVGYLEIILNLDLMRSDVVTYWQESFNWSAPFSTWWVPGYPLTIALVRALTFNILSPITVMLLTSGLFYLVSVWAVYRIVDRIYHENSMIITLAFAVFPFTGLTYSAFPLADSMAISLTLLSVLAFQECRWSAFSLYTALALITHKATWYFVPFFMLIAFIKYRHSRLLISLATIPLIALWVAGSFYHEDALWLLRWSTMNLIVSKSSLPFLDGVIGSLTSTNLPKLLKGLVVLIICIFSFILAYWNYRTQSWIGLAISIAIILMTFSINQYEIWAAVRYSKLLIIPATVILSSQFTQSRSCKMISAHGFPLLLIVGLLSNIVYGYYMAKVWALP